MLGIYIIHQLKMFFKYFLEKMNSFFERLSHINDIFRHYNKVYIFVTAGYAATKF